MNIVPKEKKKKPELKLFYDKDLLEVGIDEAGRGCLSGRVYVGAVILPKEIEGDMYKQIKDSKKLSENKRLELFDYIKDYAIDWSVCFKDEKHIDNNNILHYYLITLKIEQKHTRPYKYIRMVPNFRYL